MSTPWQSPIIRVSTGKLNTVNDTTIANAPSSVGTRSRFGAQLGKHLFVSQEQIALLTDTSVGTLYGGRYRYVRRRSTDPSSPAMAPGKLAFWNTTLTNWQTFFEVTADEDLSSSQNAIMRAGVFIGNIEPGNYGFIQDLGILTCRFRSVLTAAGAIGSPVYAAAAGDLGNDQGTFDVLTTDSTALANERAIGFAVTAPAAGALRLVIPSGQAFAWID